MCPSVHYYSPSHSNCKHPSETTRFCLSSAVSLTSSHKSCRIKKNSLELNSSCGAPCGHLLLQPVPPNSLSVQRWSGLQLPFRQIKHNSESPLASARYFLPEKRCILQNCSLWTLKRAALITPSGWPLCKMTTENHSVFNLMIGLTFSMSPLPRLVSAMRLAVHIFLEAWEGREHRKYSQT